jgi:hypothetical protein
VAGLSAFEVVVEAVFAGTVADGDAGPVSAKNENELSSLPLPLPAGAVLAPASAPAELIL